MSRCIEIKLSLSGAETLKGLSPFNDTVPIYLDQLNCIGDEENLMDCQRYIPGIHSCDHSEDVGIHCNGMNKSLQITSLNVVIEFLVSCAKYAGEDVSDNCNNA